MKKNLFLVLSFLLMIVLVANAQEKKAEEKRECSSVEKCVDKLATDLSLTGVEKASLLKLLNKHAEENRQLKEEAEFDEDAIKPKVLELKISQTGELTSLLGPERYKKMKAIEAEAKQKEAQTAK